MKKKRWLFSFIVLMLLIVMSCKITEVEIVHPEFTSAQMLQLDCIDLSENMSRVSTHEDEIVLLAFWTRNGVVMESYQSNIFSFSEADTSVLIREDFSSLEQTDKLNFFLVEIDNETFNPAIYQYCQSWVTNDSFPNHLSFLEADKYLGDDDLLGMRSVSVNELNSKTTVVFKGLQLFDRYQYDLILKNQVN